MGDDINITDVVVTIPNSDVRNKATPNKGVNNKTPDPKQDLGVMALVEIMEPVTENLSSRGPRLPFKSCPSNKIRVLLDTCSSADLYFHDNGKSKPVPYLTWQVPKSWHMSNRTFKRHRRGKLRIKFLDYSASREYLVQPDIVEYDGYSMSQPGFVILGTKTLKKLGIVQNF